MEDNCLICECGEDLMIMCKYYEFGRTRKNMNCIQLFNKCFNLKDFQPLDPAGKYSVHQNSSWIQNTAGLQSLVVRTFLTDYRSLFPKRNAFGRLNKLCVQCMNKLTSCYEFQRLAILAYDQMTEMLSWYCDAKPDTRSGTQDTETNAKQMFAKKEVHVDYVKQEADTNVKREIEFVEDDENLFNSFQDEDNVEHHYVYENVIEDESFSDSSTNTEEILIATGYYSQKKTSKKTQSGVQRVKLKTGSLECPMCLQKFYNYNITSKHYATHFPTDLCHICGKTTSTKTGFISHMTTHEERTDKFFCEPCNKVFKSRDTLRGHIKYTHKRLKAVKCYHCPEQFSGSLSRLIHMHKVHNIECEFFQCSKCDMKFYSNGKLKTHDARVHARIIRYYCDVCSNGFYDRRELRDHIKYKHEKRDLPHCDICGRNFATPKNLSTHMKIHLNIKNHKCSFCQQAFVQRTSLMFHLKKHHKNQPDVPS